jgi:hypothetical protein
VAVASGLKKTHVGELLTNPIYAGLLRTDEPARGEALARLAKTRASRSRQTTMTRLDVEEELAR